MRDRKRIIFIGPCGGGKSPSNGASYKNYYLLRHLEEKLGHLSIIDTEMWRKSPMLVIKLFFVILLNNDARYIVSANSKSAYWLFWFFSFLPFSKRSIIYWAIGGAIANKIFEGKYAKRAYLKVDWFIVEGKKMKQTLALCGFYNVIVVPNFKKYDVALLESLKLKSSRTHVRFVFLSRILPEKGVDLILKACEELSEKYEFSVVFYGPIEKKYKDVFLNRINSLYNVKYEGFLDLRLRENYKVLSDYDVMLFPTYWDGEGFPGVIVDSYIAGLPVIASDWSMNREIIEDNVTGWIILSKNLDALIRQMIYVIESESVLLKMSENCQVRARQFCIDNVVNDDLLNKLGLLDF